MEDCLHIIIENSIMISLIQQLEAPMEHLLVWLHSLGGLLKLLRFGA